MDIIQNSVLRMVKEVFETEDIDELAARLATGKWVAIAALQIGDHQYRFCLGRVR